jgi:hypothetical protein
MRDSTNRRLIILFVLSLILSLGAITLGILGMMDMIDSGLVENVREWIEPVISIRRDGPPTSGDDFNEDTFSALDVEATRLADKQDTVSEIYTNWPVIFRESYVSNDVDWPVFEKDGDLAKIDAKIEDGKYRWEAKASQGFVWWAYPNLEPLGDVYVEIEVNQVEGAKYGEMGLVIRLTEDRYYLYRVSGGEYYSFYRSDPDGWTELIGWTTSTLIHPSGRNTLGILAVEDRFYLFINGQLVAETNDSLLETGLLGVAIGLDESEDVGTFEFDNLVIRAPEGIADNPPEPSTD